MCIILKEDYENIGWELMRIVTEQEHIFIDSPLQEFEDSIKNELADLKEAKVLAYCGCDGIFQLKKIDDGYLVNMEILNKITQYWLHISYDLENPYWEMDTSNISEVIDGYHNMIYNEYKEE
jgi:hypothetical protein